MRLQLRLANHFSPLLDDIIEGSGADAVSRHLVPAQTAQHEPFGPNQKTPVDNCIHQAVIDGDNAVLGIFPFYILIHSADPA